MKTAQIYWLTESGRSSDYKREIAIQIVTELEGLPLAIKNAGYSIHGLGDYEPFLKSYRERNFEAFGLHEDLVRKTFQFLLDEVKKRNSDADTLLMHCAMLDQKPIPETLIKKLLSKPVGFDDEDKIFDGVTKTLRRFSLLENGEQAKPQSTSQNDVEPLTTIRPIIIRQMKEIPDPDERKLYARKYCEGCQHSTTAGEMGQVVYLAVLSPTCT